MRRATHQAAVGLFHALLIVAGWLALHIYAVFFHSVAGGALASVLLVPALCWLGVGLFIVAHDCMHGSLAPGSPRINRSIGRVALTLYAAFSFDRLRAKHFEHHLRPGSPSDPDFSADHPRHFWRWYVEFFGRYFGIRELTVLATAVSAYVVVLGASLANVLLLWAVPAILSSLQLFLFGTFLPHRVKNTPFVDSHHARSNEFSWIVSLLTCFHFGYHHEHHRTPGTPWWRLPSERVRTMQLGCGSGHR